MIGQDRIVAALEALPVALEAVRADIAAGLQSFHQALPLQGARYLGIGATGAQTLAWAGPGRLVGWSVRATGGPVTVVVRDSRTGVGEIIAVIELAKDTSETIWLGGGVSVTEGLHVSSYVPPGDDDGVIQGALYLGAVD